MERQTGTNDLSQAIQSAVSALQQQGGGGMQQGEPGTGELVRDRVREALRERLQDALAIRWVLDQPGVSVALWGARHPQELAPVDGVLGWHLDDEARVSVDRIIAENVKDPVGPEFMAPSETHAEAA